MSNDIETVELNSKTKRPELRSHFNPRKLSKSRAISSTRTPENNPDSRILAVFEEAAVDLWNVYSSVSRFISIIKKIESCDFLLGMAESENHLLKYSRGFVITSAWIWLLGMVLTLEVILRPDPSDNWHTCKRLHFGCNQPSALDREILLQLASTSTNNIPHFCRPSYSIQIPGWAISFCALSRSRGTLIQWILVTRR